MTRDELIEAVIPALGLSYVRHPGYAQERARRVIDAVEPLIRADEREAWLLVAAIDKVQMADLRAKVEALASPDPEYNNAIRDVLALFDGGSDE